MHDFLAVIVSNALVVVPLAVLAALIAYRRGPAPLVRGLCVLLLLKLVTPPVVRVDIPENWVQALRGLQTVEADATLNDGPGVSRSDAPGDSAVPLSVSTQPWDSFTARDAEFTDRPNLQAIADSTESEDPELLAAFNPSDPKHLILEEPATGWVASIVQWIRGLNPGQIAFAAIAAWILGSLYLLGLSCLRLVRMQRWVRTAELAPDAVQRMARTVASNLGLSRSPSVRLVDARISPFLWALGGKPAIVVPRELLRQLPPDQQETVLAHELAHYRRRDHWVRWLELVAVALYWWHPVVWWARRRMRDAEELCCDALVASRYPERVRSYARSLLHVTDFIARPVPAAPCSSSAIGAELSLKRRLEMLIHRNGHHRMSWAARAGLAIVATAVLPWSAAYLRAQDVAADEVIAGGLPAGLPQECDDLSEAPKAICGVCNDGKCPVSSAFPRVWFPGEMPAGLPGIAGEFGPVHASFGLPGEDSPQAMQNPFQNLAFPGGALPDDLTNPTESPFASPSYVWFGDLPDDERKKLMKQALEAQKKWQEHAKQWQEQANKYAQEWNEQLQKHAQQEGQAQWPEYSMAYDRYQDLAKVLHQNNKNHQVSDDYFSAASNPFAKMSDEDRKQHHDRLLKAAKNWQNQAKNWQVHQEKFQEQWKAHQKKLQDSWQQHQQKFNDYWQQHQGELRDYWQQYENQPPPHDQWLQGLHQWNQQPEQNPERLDAFKRYIDDFRSHTDPQAASAVDAFKRYVDDFRSHTDPEAASAVDTFRRYIDDFRSHTDPQAASADADPSDTFRRYLDLETTRGKSDFYSQEARDDSPRKGDDTDRLKAQIDKLEQQIHQLKDQLNELQAKKKKVKRKTL